MAADPQLTDAAAGQLREYFAGRRRQFELDWRLVRSSQKQVLKTLYESVDYGAHRHLWPAPHARSVPCRRVQAADGPGGFGGGPLTERLLLTREGALDPTLDPGV